MLVYRVDFFLKVKKKKEKKKHELVFFLPFTSQALEPVGLSCVNSYFIRLPEFFSSFLFSLVLLPHTCILWVIILSVPGSLPTVFILPRPVSS